MNRLRARYAGQADPLRSERRVELMLVGCGGLLLALALYLLLRIVLATDVEPIAPAPDSVRVATLAVGEALPVEEREALLARPLFWAGRLPEEAAGEPAVVAEAEKPGKAAPRMKDVTVHGVYGSGETGGVILSVKQRELRVAVGDEVEGWRLEGVTGDSAVFVSGGVRDERELVPQVIEAPAPAATRQEASASAAAGGKRRAAAAPDDRDDAAAGAAAAEEEPRLTLGGVR